MESAKKRRNGERRTCVSAAGDLSDRGFIVSSGQDDAGVSARVYRP